MKIKHILSSHEFENIIRNGKKIKGKILSFYSKESKGTKDIFVGVVVSKKFASLAVTRNYIKRRIYSFFNERSGIYSSGIKIVTRLAVDIKSFNRKELSQALLKDLEVFAGKC